MNVPSELNEASQCISRFLNRIGQYKSAVYTDGNIISIKIQMTLRVKKKIYWCILYTECGLVALEFNGENLCCKWDTIYLIPNFQSNNVKL